MTSRIPNYTNQPAFAAAIAKDPARHFTAAQLVSYAVGAPLTPKGYAYSNTDYILAQMIIQRVTHDSYADQLTKRIITPLHLHTLCYAPPPAPPPTLPSCRPGTSSNPSALACREEPCPRSPKHGPRAPERS